MDVNATGQANRIFVSYAHLDDELLNQAVEHFTHDLKAFYAAQNGGHLEIFFDRDSIGWGSDWRRRIDDDLRGASIFMPVITMQYFNRPACREELNAFYASAELLGAEFLILPVVILGAARITADHSMPEVRLIESIQFENLEECFIAGRGTREWRQALSRIAEKLGAIIDRAEEKMSSSSEGRSDEVEIAVDEDFDFLEHAEQLNQIGDRLPGEMEAAEQDLTEWCSIVTAEMQQLGAASRSAMRARSIAMAQVIRVPSLKLQDSASTLAGSVSQADALMRAMVGQLNGVRTKEGSELAAKLVRSLTDGSTDLRELSSGLVEILGMLKTMELLSVPLRKSIKPGRVGFAKIQDAVTTIDGWSAIQIA
ncbi:toll/interleukin-1 receptor domain-containing protein [Streptomyces sp. F8]|uniref:toll/interleukin-1 receptor domain-containing protein n=1 Tax=Streptomyces sp. F8 TaxID=1436085 RepID=UPI0029CCE37C|nr:toll/interleukin-1 receptor domain-containing protein [Streptomyces sp. F8]MDX6760508.1 toll/interleukin-1 receptor domain-containing protein [Streptomyces sp. F8]